MGRSAPLHLLSRPAGQWMLIHGPSSRCARTASHMGRRLAWWRTHGISAPTSPQWTRRRRQVRRRAHHMSTCWCGYPFVVGRRWRGWRFSYRKGGKGDKGNKFLRGMTEFLKVSTKSCVKWDPPVRARLLDKEQHICHILYNAPSATLFGKSEVNHRTLLNVLAPSHKAAPYASPSAPSSTARMFDRSDMVTSRALMR